MGTSTDAILCYGLNFGDTDGLDSETVRTLENWEDIACKALGLVDDSGFFTEQGDYALPPGSPEFTRRQTLWDAFCERKRETLKGLGVEVLTHCHYDYPMYCAVIPKTVTVAGRGEPEAIDPLSMVLDELVVNEYKERISRFCELLNLPWVGSQAKWWLVSYWG